jgi:PIN domain nuclease of toxin-antitoxin system
MLEKSLVLDTCALLWLVKGDERLSRDAKEAMRAQAWFESSLERHSLIAAAVDVDIAFRATALPRIHKDPADRFIIATAMGLSAAVVTADATFKEYGIRVIA